MPFNGGMQIAPEIIFRHLPKSPYIESLVRRQAAKLEKFCDHITSCRVAIERPQQHQRAGNPYRVRIDLTVPPGHEVVVDREPTDNDIHDELRTVVIDAFKAARRQLQELVDRQRKDVKTHEEPRALVVRLLRDEGWGFLQTPDGREVYFHRNSVLHNEFDRLAVGTEVRFEQEEGEKGPQATSVQIVSKVAAPASARETVKPEPPLG